MKKLTIAFYKACFLFKMWNVIQVKKKGNRTGQPCYMCSIANAYNCDIITYDVRTKRISIVLTEHVFRETEGKKLTESAKLFYESL